MEKYKNVLRRLNDHKVNYMIVGGVAVTAYGRDRVTFDLDIAIEPTEQNVERLLLALRDADVPGAESMSVSKVLSAKESTFLGSIAAVDIHPSPPGLNFDVAYERREIADLDGIEVAVAAVEDLIAMKQATGRPKDMENVEFLLAHYE